MARQTPQKKIVTKKHLAREQREAKQNRILLIVSIAVGAVILGLAIFGVIDKAITKPRTPLARVGETKITVREYTPFVQYSRVQMLNQAYQYFSFYQQFGDLGGNLLDTARSIAAELSQPVVFGRTVLDEMIDNVIIKDEAEKRNVVVSEPEIDRAVQAVFGFFPEGTQTPTIAATAQPTPTYSKTQLALINTPTSVIEESDSVESDEEADINGNAFETTGQYEIGISDDEDFITEEEFSDLIDVVQSDDSLVSKKTPAPTPTITLTPTVYTTAIYAKNVKDFEKQFKIYNFNIKNLREIFRIQLLREKLTEALEFDLETSKNEVWARHILVEEEELALEILSRIEEGESFFDLAAEFSMDESNKNQGGDLGWFDENTMVPEFTEAAFNLEKEGEISSPVKTTFGYHIIQLIGKRKTQLTDQQLSQLKAQAFSEWLAEQRLKRDDIEIYDHWDKYVPTTPEVPPQFISELYKQPQ
jgi:parvulin-like peptidyl-prolyl isomerase